MASKRKVTITLDEDLVTALVQASISGQLNEAGWALVQRRQRGTASLDTRDTDRQPARIVDAHVVAVAVEAGGGVVETGDEHDLGLLRTPYRHIVVEAV
jgi:hypothetical protein